ncbi:MAG: hypothetical protein J6U86_06765, partial [Clostridia bacterium]|nr:hypothetical protein [Clostridia bacterium]
MKNNTDKAFIYFRYIFPLVMVAVMVVLMFIPSYSYVTANEGAKQSVSLWDLLRNSWKTVREYLFGSGTKYDITIEFASVLITIIIAFSLMFFLGAVFSLYCITVAMRYFANNCQENRAHIIFITLVPNRIALCLYSALTLPIFFIPMIMPLFYKNFLYYQVKLSQSSFDMVYIALALYAAFVLIVTISAKVEIRANKNIFSSICVALPDEHPEEEHEE